MSRSYEEYVGKLQGEYLEAFRKIELYFDSSELFAVDIDETMNEILDMMLMAQSENKQVEKVIGSDMKEFCSNYVKESYPKHTAKVTFSVSVCFLLLVYILCAGASAGKYFLHEIDNIWTGTYDAGAVTLGLLSGTLAGFIIDFIAKNTVFKLGAKRTKRFKKLVWLFAGILACTVVGIKESVGFRFDISLRNTTFLIIYIVMIISTIYVIHKIALETTDEDVYREKTVNFIKKQYDKENEKRKSRGREEISSSEFINKKIKDQVISRYITPIMIAVILCEVIYFLCIRGLHNIFSVISLILVFIMIVIILFLIDYIFKFKVNKEIIESLKEDNL